MRIFTFLLSQVSKRILSKKKKNSDRLYVGGTLTTTDEATRFYNDMEREEIGKILG